jgi:hypothetical protein
MGPRGVREGQWTDLTSMLRPAEFNATWAAHGIDKASDDTRLDTFLTQSEEKEKGRLELTSRTNVSPDPGKRFTAK